MLPSSGQEIKIRRSSICLLLSFIQSPGVVVHPVPCQPGCDTVSSICHSHCRWPGLSRNSSTLPLSCTKQTRVDEPDTRRLGVLIGRNKDISRRRSRNYFICCCILLRSSSFPGSCMNHPALVPSLPELSRPDHAASGVTTDLAEHI